jgi:hypothetical protein
MPTMKRKTKKAKPAPAVASKETAGRPVEPTDVPINPASLARRKRALLDALKDPDTPQPQRDHARDELELLSEVPILSHHELARLG